MWGHQDINFIDVPFYTKYMNSIFIPQNDTIHGTQNPTSSYVGKFASVSRGDEFKKEKMIGQML